MQALVTKQMQLFTATFSALMHVQMEIVSTCLFLTSGMVLVVMPVSTHAHSIEGQATQTVASLSGISKYEAHPLMVNVLH